MSPDVELSQRLQREQRQKVEDPALPVDFSEDYVSQMGRLPGSSKEDISIIESPRPSVGLPAFSREEMNKLVHHLFLMAGVETIAVAFCGMEDSRGSAWICACAADMLAHQIDRPVCIVDANVRSPMIHGHFGLENEMGLTTRLRQPGPLHRLATRVAGNLWVLTAGPWAENCSNLLSSKNLQAYVSELRQDYEFVLFNTAPFGIHSDALRVGKVVDGIVLVLEAEVTRRESAESAKNALTQAGVQVLGAVLNNRRFPIPEKLYAKL